MNDYSGGWAPSTPSGYLKFGITGAIIAIAFFYFGIIGNSAIILIGGFIAMVASIIFFTRFVRLILIRYKNS